MRLCVVICAAAATTAMAKAPSTPPLVSIDLDQPPEQRWAHVAPAFKQYWPAVHDYMASNVPRWSVPLIEAVAGRLIDYFGAEAGAEMESLAKLLGAPKVARAA